MAGGEVRERVMLCVRNTKLWERYSHRRREVAEENHNQSNERMLFHGSPFIRVTTSLLPLHSLFIKLFQAIVQKGFDERHAYIGGMFGAGIYFAEHSSKVREREIVLPGSQTSSLLFFRAISTFTVSEVATVVLNTKTDLATLATGQSLRVVSSSDLNISRQLLLCRVALGKSFLQFSAMKMAHAPPGHHSVVGR